MTRILYVGESKDFSDKWIIDQISSHYNIELLNINQINQNIPILKDVILVVNRLYASAIERYGKSKIREALEVIDYLSSNGTPVLNSTAGYQLYINRLSQFRYFCSRKLPYIETFELGSIQENHMQKRPYVIKNIEGGRTKKLQIIDNVIEFLSCIQTDDKIVLQPLVKSKVCYRTEFVGRWSKTFVQNIKIQGNSLTFWHNGIVPTPLSAQFKRTICQAMDDIGVQFFSIEYFLLNTEPLIIDFNSTSNYSKPFINHVGIELKKAWLEVIKNAI